MPWLTVKENIMFSLKGQDGNSTNSDVSLPSPEDRCQQLLQELELTEDELYDRLQVMSFFIEECYKREFLEEFPEEVESAFIDDMYMKSLFTYIAITPAKKRKPAFLKMLQEDMLDCFPEFETNPYYYEKYDDDIKDLVSLHMANPNKFLKATMKMDSL